MPGGAQTDHTQLEVGPSPDFMDRMVNFVNRMFWVSGNSPTFFFFCFPFQKQEPKLCF